ncbi:hypothetical protein [Flavobacterium hydatis]|uniref:Uncharacterized protein n=1 Tax=Flavobacterium hydatis TaxID=991 RepID=A0A086AH90_FLAHY|nr:hypothetical protein [Flavobacterium hydatis]KFF16054.1 hypothetical protein IW20_11965 [Flavobacterium hydatis]OXA97592.1 hypothetical protein B0A62_01655 [Flavobacterium hydatis]
MTIMLKKNITLFLLCLTGICFSQEFPEKEKKYDVDIYEFLMKSVEKDSVSFETFLINSKPFSKWDIRPLKREQVWALDTFYNANQVPNFIFGAFSNKYNIAQKTAMNMPNQFLAKGHDKKDFLENYLKENLKKFKKLTTLISANKSEIFTFYERIQRVDNLYKEKELYWRYIIPIDSPFPLSNKIESDVNDGFSKEQIKILDLLQELNIYSAVKTKKGIFYLVDGLTDNSYGFYFNSKEEMETDNFLFQIQRFEKINDNFFYYIAN